MTSGAWFTCSCGQRHRIQDSFVLGECYEVTCSGCRVPVTMIFVSGKIDDAYRSLDPNAPNDRYVRVVQHPSPRHRLSRLLD